MTKPATSNRKNLSLVETRGETPHPEGIMMPSLLHASKPEAHQQIQAGDCLENCWTSLTGHYSHFVPVAGAGLSLF